MSTSNNCGRKRYGKMARKFSGLEAKMSPASLARSDEKLAKLREEMALNELRVALTITQEHLAKILRSEEHTSELQSLRHLVCRLLLEKKRILNVKWIESVNCRTRWTTSYVRHSW